MHPSVARDTLERARFFLERAAAISADDRVAFRHFTESAIVFARSVTLHLQKQYARAPEFPGWYAGWQARLRADPLALFFTEKRNYVLKEGPLDIRKHIHLQVHEQARATMTVTVTVVRGRPWYRRSAKVLIHDASSPLRMRLHRLIGERRRQPASGPQHPKEVMVSDSLRFSETPWTERPALDLISEYLDTLGTLVEEADAIFGSDNPEAA